MKRLTPEQKEQAIKAYIKHNTKPITCSKCKTAENLIEDINYGSYTDKAEHQDIFCQKCLHKSLLKDRGTLVQTFIEHYQKE